MLNKFTSAGLIVALVVTLGGTSAFANSMSDSEFKPEVAKPATDSGSAASPMATEATKSNHRLRLAMNELVADAKAGKVMPAAKSQIQPAKSNNWSKGTKIAVGVGIAVAVIVVIAVVTKRNSPGSINPF